jgi:hypothetical protein
MSFVPGRRFPSRLRNQGAYEIKGESKKKNNSAAKKEKSKVLFLQREFLVLLSLVAYLTLSGNLAPHTQKLSLFNIPKTDKTHLYGEQEESDRTRVSRDHQ